MLQRDPNEVEQQSVTRLCAVHMSTSSTQQGDLGEVQPTALTAPTAVQVPPGSPGVLHHHPLSAQVSAVQLVHRVVRIAVVVKLHETKSGIRTETVWLSSVGSVGLSCRAQQRQVRPTHPDGSSLKVITSRSELMF